MIPVPASDRPANDTPPILDACAASIEIDRRQAYLFETDKLQEMLGASLIMSGATECAKMACQAKPGVHLFQPASGDLRFWARRTSRDDLLAVVWMVRAYLTERGVEHTVAYLETQSRHFEQSRSPGAHRKPDGDKEPDQPDLGWVTRQLSERAKAQRAARTDGDARPRCSLFASCRIHPLDVANRWTHTGNDREPRRNQVGFRAEAKRAAWTAAKKRQDGKLSFYDQHLIEPFGRRFDELDVALPGGRAISFRDLEEAVGDLQSEDQFIAFVCADLDGMGKLLLAADWNDPDWPTDWPSPWLRNRAFSEQLERALQQAFYHGITVATVPDEEKASALIRDIWTDGEVRIRLPVLPQLLGGDDQWFVANRRVALDISRAMADQFAIFVSEDGGKIPGPDEPNILPELSRRACGRRVSLSSGVAFAKAGYPAHAMIDAAEYLVGSAKRRRNDQTWDSTQEQDQGCIDWHWIESSLSEEVKDARKTAWAYRSTAESDDEQFILVLTTRPWTVFETGGMIDAARIMGDIPRRKVEQLEAILRRGYHPSHLAWESWWKSLKTASRTKMLEIQNTLQKASLGLPAPPDDVQVPFSPWISRTPSVAQEPKDGPPRRYYRTPLLDLVSLQDVLRRSDARDEGDQQSGHAS